MKKDKMDVANKTKIYMDWMDGLARVKPDLQWMSEIQICLKTGCSEVQ